MRISIFWIIILITLLFSNIIFYITNEEYRFFVQKLRHGDTLIETQSIIIDDSVPLPEQRLSWLFQTWTQEETETLDARSQTALEFLESTIQGGSRRGIDTDTLDILPSETSLLILSLLEQYALDSIKPEEYLFSVTREFPDPFLQWYSSDVSFYSFPTKWYREVFDIFDVLSFELPISLNQVNNIGDKSFFINMDSGWDDSFVRVVFEYENEAFWLKIKNIHYNAIRDLLAEQL